MQITIIGGGSYQWAPTLIVDLLRTESIRPLRLVLEDIDPVPLPTMEAFAKLAAQTLGTEVDVTTTTDQRRALEGADFVVVTISTGGFPTMRVDLEVPARHGIYQSVGDSVGPGGVNRALRNIPVLVGIGHDMEEVCPDAWMLNITNPMTCLTRSVCRGDVDQDGRALPRGRELLSRSRDRVGDATREDAADGRRREPLPGHHRSRRRRHRRARPSHHHGRSASAAGTPSRRRHPERRARRPSPSPSSTSLGATT